MKLSKQQRELLLKNFKVLSERKNSDSLDKEIYEMLQSGVGYLTPEMRGYIRGFLNMFEKSLEVKEKIYTQQRDAAKSEEDREVIQKYLTNVKNLLVTVRGIKVGRWNAC